MSAIQLARQRAEQELLQTQKALRETTQRLQLALHGGPPGRLELGREIGPRYAERRGRRHLRPAPRNAGHVGEHARAACTRTTGRGRGGRGTGGGDRSDYDIEYRIAHPHLGERWIAAKGRATYRGDGDLLGMTGVVQDVTSASSGGGAAPERRALPGNVQPGCRRHGDGVARRPVRRIQREVRADPR